MTVIDRKRSFYSFIFTIIFLQLQHRVVRNLRLFSWLAGLDFIVIESRAVISILSHVSDCDDLNSIQVQYGFQVLFISILTVDKYIMASFRRGRFLTMFEIEPQNGNVAANTKHGTIIA